MCYRNKKIRWIFRTCVAWRKKEEKTNLVYNTWIQSIKCVLSNYPTFLKWTSVWWTLEMVYAEAFMTLDCKPDLRWVYVDFSLIFMIFMMLITLNILMILIILIILRIVIFIIILLTLINPLKILIQWWINLNMLSLWSKSKSKSRDTPS